MRILYLTVGLLTMCLGCGWGFTGTPPPTARWVRVSVRAQGLAANEIELLVTGQVEAGLATLPHVQRVQSVSYPNEMVVWSKFDPATSSAEAISQIANALDTVNQWPAEAIEPHLRAVSPGPILLLALHQGTTASELDSVVTVSDVTVSELCSSLASALQCIPHVADVSVLGQSRLQIEIAVDQDKLPAFGVSGDEIEGILQRQFLQMTPLRADEDSMIRMINEIPLRHSSDGPKTMLGDVASVRLRLVEPSGPARLPSGETWPPGWILFGVHIDSVANTSACSDAVQRALDSFPLPAGVEIVRDLDSHPAQILTLAGVAWSRLIPPDMQLHPASSPAWHSYFTPGQPDFMYRVTGPDFGELRQIAAEVRNRLGQDPQVTSARIDGGATQPELRIEVDRDKVAAFGVSDRAVMHAAQSIPLGARHLASVEVMGSGEEPRPQWADVVLLPAGDSGSLDAEYLSELQIRIPSGGTVPLGQLCRLSLVEEPTEIRRDQHRRYVGVRITTRDQSASVRNGIRARLSDYQRQLEKTHPRYQLEFLDAE